MFNSKNSNLTMFPKEVLPVREIRAMLVEVNEEETSEKELCDVKLTFVVIDTLTKEAFVFEEKLEKWALFGFVSEYFDIDFEESHHIYFSDLIGATFDAQIVYEVRENGVISKLVFKKMIVAPVKEI